MSPDICFQIFNPIALLAWITLLFFPNAKVTQNLVRSGIISLVLACGYWLAFGMSLQSDPLEGAGFSSLEAVKKLFSNDWALLAGWIHYLCFDLLIGVEVQRTLEKRHFLIRALCLLSTFLFGPVGWSLSFFLKSRHPVAV